jgi:uncharacterized protein
VSTMTNGRTADTADHAFWRDHSTIVLSPVAAPSILGLFGFAAATFMVAANMAGWYGSTDTPLVLFPFALTAGGIAQLLAGMWAYRARDAIATAMHGIWGSFWIAYGLYTLLIALGVLPSTTSAGSAPGAFGLWFVVLAAITWVGAIAATADNTALTALLVMLAAGSTLLAIALLAATPTVLVIGAYLLIISALIAWYLAAALMLEAAYNRPVLPTGKRHTAQAIDVLTSNPIQYAAGEPGVKVGQ